MIQPIVLNIQRKAIDLLARREYSLKELTAKLAVNFDSGLVIKQLSQLADKGLQSDRRFAESFINAHCARGKGPLFIGKALQQRGIGPELLASVIDDADEKWFHLARVVYEKKFANKPAVNLQEKAKRLRFMEQRGFSHEQIKSAMA